MNRQEIEEAFSTHVLPMSARDYIKFNNNMRYVGITSMEYSAERKLSKAFFDCKKGLLLQMELKKGEVITNLTINTQQVQSGQMVLMYGNILVPNCVYNA